MRADELKDPRDRAYAERVESKPSLYRGFAGIGPYNAFDFSKLEMFLLITNQIYVDNRFCLDILVYHFMAKEFENLPGIAKHIEESEIEPAGRRLFGSTLEEDRSPWLGINTTRKVAKQDQ